MIFNLYFLLKKYKYWLYLILLYLNFINMLELINDKLEGVNNTYILLFNNFPIEANIFILSMVIIPLITILYTSIWLFTLFFESKEKRNTKKYLEILIIWIILLIIFWLMLKVVWLMMTTFSILATVILNMIIYKEISKKEWLYKFLQNR